MKEMADSIVDDDHAESLREIVGGTAKEAKSGKKRSKAFRKACSEVGHVRSATATPIPIVAYSATMSAETRTFVMICLALESPFLIELSADRPSIFIDVHKLPDDLEYFQTDLVQSWIAE